MSFDGRKPSHARTVDGLIKRGCESQLALARIVAHESSNERRVNDSHPLNAFSIEVFATFIIVSIIAVMIAISRIDHIACESHHVRVFTLGMSQLHAATYKSWRLP